MLSNLLNKTCNVQYKELTQSELGETSETWTTKGTHKTRYEKSKQTRVIDETYKISLDDYLFFFETDVEINRDDRIVVDETIFEVISSQVIDGYSAKHHIEVYARKYDHE
jgi:head-tail adaptor